MKTLRLSLCTIALLLCSIAANAQDFNFSVNNIYYVFTSESTVMVVSSPEYYSGDVSIPSTVTYDNKTYSVTSIENYAFGGCVDLSSITIPESVTSIGEGAFHSCYNLSSITIPEGVTSIRGYVFYDCKKLSSIIIPKSVTIIGSSAFEGCDNLSSVSIPEGVTSIGEGAFHLCDNLSSISIPKSVTFIGSSAFQGCSNLSSVSIPEGVTSIESSAFEGCLSLSSITIPEGVTSIGDAAFSMCSSITKIVIPKGVTSIGNYAFNCCFKLSSITIPESVTSIGESAFKNCTNLEYVSIYGYVKSIGNYAFSGCSSLDRFSFGYTIESIGKEAFSDCTNLTSIIIPVITPPVCGEQALDDIDKLNCVLTVPSGYAGAYQQAEQWKEFARVEDVVEIMEIRRFILIYLVDDEVYHCDTLAYNESIVLPEEPTKEGHTFNGWDGLPETMPAQEYLTINASFSVNTYKVYYYVGEELVHTAEVAYGDTIPEYIYEPSAEGEVLKGWEGETYETMPAHDVTYKANIINGINSVLLDPSSLIIYDLQGRKITNTEDLQNGIYIINDQKVLIQK